MTEQYVYGMHAVQALLTRKLRPVKALFVNEERADQRMHALLELAKQRQIPVERLSLAKMQQQFADYTHQGIVAKAGALPEYTEQDVLRLVQDNVQPCLILILDGVTDPHNLGACLRSADGAGANFVIIPKDKNASLTPAVSKVACGAAESVPLIRVTNLVRIMELLKQEGVWIYGAAGEAENTIYDLDYTGSIAMVMGAEDKGMRRLTREHCDALFSLPMLGSVSSLNVSVATGISLYEVVRQRQGAAR
ncbi:MULTISPECIES: 23S rRNA (guanosine(2251)-2'-O)-methyltransferase RlmB [Legionella]|uniref:23S rRNA (guanosine-2'-O-)-methyltransferase RlmB n=1 Tax=Legionella septentrionalis TaxID=2498109 RepID=A0A3S1CML7_9GAMM|nr:MULTISPECIES: 23S rRNA (guanosine(2251)-2'-O)-methyltransferase RlmB [Legionella]MCP0914782.1 23S rRNA (guanosine(2251)-2'-O)-methyltransferase RlmB [Legionella sp. 27cVA30]RUQ91083.1 23S rRNA (guanosine(2251)-2'-O)-methyltransferase RlmB [Legionella septentrionalis]RUR02848.1 23S rRNA (guanosine(2251)-2'-O)-methyltransferase RlmB [Legionella septentrionalis]RUR11446.1 23S rRNA (guanosine(2251)-2'-O)-methyltransferase RlmB [Legionella septentrionalis]RUR16711.1 23S rRNA (guanosine(2251)-2'-